MGAWESDESAKVFDAHNVVETYLCFTATTVHTMVCMIQCHFPHGLLHSWSVVFSHIYEFATYPSNVPEEWEAQFKQGRSQEEGSALSATKETR